MVTNRRVPGEWEAHSATVVTWPGRRSVWAGHEESAGREYANLIKLIARDEPVLVLVAEADSVFGPLPEGQNITHVEIATNDSWIRDNGPIVVLDEVGRPVAVDFRFNSWGRRFVPYDLDDQASELLSDFLGLPRDRVELVLEGGAISFNGVDLAIVVEECVLNPNRNGVATRQDFENVVRSHLGVTDVIWLPYGLEEDLHNTDGHVDNVAVFTSESDLLMQRVSMDNPNYERMEANIEAVSEWCSHQGRNLTVRHISQLPYIRLSDGSTQPCSFINFAVTSNSVILPVVGDVPDEKSLEVFASAFPSRRVVSTPANALVWGGGGPHCVTMQLPSPVVVPGYRPN